MAEFLEGIRDVIWNSGHIKKQKVDTRLSHFFAKTAIKKVGV
jgi:hypothetical protein